MKAISYQGKDSIELVEKPVPQIFDGGILIKVAYAGICGTDLAILAGNHPRATPPLVMGHEISGRIADVARGSPPHLQISDRVTVNPLLACGTCYTCRNGTPNVCRNFKLLGIDEDGGFAEFVLVKGEAVHKLPQGLNDYYGALIEPLAVCVHAARISRISIGDVAIVTGAGPIGLLMAEVAVVSGANRVIVTEVDPIRISIGRELGFTVLNAADDDLVERVLDLSSGQGGDILFETTGHPSVLHNLLDLVRIQGQIIEVGVFKHPASLDLQTLTFKEINMVGSRVYTQTDFERAIRLTADQKIDLKSIPFQRIPLEEPDYAFQIAKKSEYLKILFEVS